MSISRTQSARDRKRKKIRAKISGSLECPRLSVFKSNTTLYVQIIDDHAGRTLGASRGVDAVKVGQEIAQVAKTKGITKIVFDRGGYPYAGKIKALAEAAREASLKF